MSMKINPFQQQFQQQGAQGLQKSAQKLTKAGDKNDNQKLNFGELQNLQKTTKTDPAQFQKNFGMNVKQLEQFQKLGDQKNFSKAAGQDGQMDANEMAKALSQTNIPGQRLNLMA